MNCISCECCEFIKYSEGSYLGIPVFQCKKCKLLVTGSSIQEIREAISSRYSGDFWDIEREHTPIKSDYTDSISKSKYRNFVSQLAFCKPYIGNKRKILEIGSGEGQTIFWLDQMGYKVIGIEPDDRNTSRINSSLKNSKVIQGFIEDFEDDGEYDIIWMSHVLEHLAEPDIFLQKIKGRLGVNGIFFIEVPNSEHRNTLKDSIFGSPHVYHFSKDTLVSLCKRLGFEIIACDIFRPATKFEGMLNKLFKKIINLYPHYPRIVCDRKSGRDLRILLKRQTLG